jgi:fluoride ion exporter CrcB/FEX
VLKKRWKVIKKMIWILLAVLCGVLCRIILMEEYLILPTWENKTLKLNTLGTIIIGVVAVVVIMEASPDQITTPLQGFVFAYIAPYAIDKLNKVMDSEQ